MPVIYGLDVVSNAEHFQMIIDAAADNIRTHGVTGGSSRKKLQCVFDQIDIIWTIYGEQQGDEVLHAWLQLVKGHALYRSAKGLPSGVSLTALICKTKREASRILRHWGEEPDDTAALYVPFRPMSVRAHA